MFFFTLRDNLQDVPSTIKSGYYGVVEIFMSFLYSAGFRKEE